MDMADKTCYIIFIIFYYYISLILIIPGSFANFSTIQF